MNYCDRLEMGDMVYNFVGKTRHIHEMTPQLNHNLKFIILVTFLRATESVQKPLRRSNQFLLGPECTVFGRIQFSSVDTRIKAINSHMLDAFTLPFTGFFTGTSNLLVLLILKEKRKNVLCLSAKSSLSKVCCQMFSYIIFHIPSCKNVFVEVMAFASHFCTFSVHLIVASFLPTCHSFIFNNSGGI